MHRGCRHRAHLGHRVSAAAAHFYTFYLFICFKSEISSSVYTGAYFYNTLRMKNNSEGGNTIYNLLAEVKVLHFLDVRTASDERWMDNK